MQRKNESILKRLQNVDTRIIYTLLIIALVVPLLKPLGMPIPISSIVQKFYGTVDSLKPGDVVVYSFEFGAGDYPEGEGAGVAVKRHLFSKNVKIIFVTTNDQSPLVLLRSLQSTGIPPDKKYGVDYAFLGYMAGAETAIAALASNMHATFKVDQYGTPIEQLPILNGVNSARDVNLLVVEGGGQETPTQYVRQWYTAYKVPYLAICISVVAPTLQPFVGAGQIIAMVVGAAGGAQYELLIRRPGVAVASMDAQAFGHFLIIAFIILGNIAYFVTKRKGK
jgi:hypothetical protein